MEVKNTIKDYENVASINILVYGVGGVGKTTFAATFPKPIMFDFENGAKYFKQRGINIDVVKMDKWFKTDEKRQLTEMVKDYETIIFDPIGEAMEKLIKSDEITGSKYRQSNGDLAIGGWGKVKDEMRTMLKWARDTGKHIVIVAHDVDVPLTGSDGQTKKIPFIATKLGTELVNMVDIVAYLDIIQQESGIEKRVLRVNPADQGYIAKDRTESLGKYVKPDFDYIYEQIQNNQPKDKKVAKKTTKKPKDVVERVGEPASKDYKVGETMNVDVTLKNPFPAKKTK